MKIIAASIPGAFVIELERLEDERGYFARTFDRGAFEAHGMKVDLQQCSLAYNRRKGTIRGMHYQAEPHGEVKIVSCIRGAIHDVIVDLRRESPAFRRWEAVELSAASHRGLYIPKGVAHGYQTLTDDAEVFYEMASEYRPEAGRGVRWNDPAFGIAWPLEVTVISARDAGYAGFGS